MASKRVTCGEASGWNRCRKPADHDGECAKPPTARERRLLRLLRQWLAWAKVRRPTFPFDATERELARGKAKPARSKRAK